jgi:potassium channel subfamily K
MNKNSAPIRPGETYSQGFWYAIIAAVLYLIGSMILMVNMTGYFLGHYPQHFELDDDQRTLILQTMMFFFWLAGGAAVFSKVCGWSYADALYFCDVTVLTVGFGDFTSPNDAGRGLVLPYSVLGIIFLGLMINSIRKFAAGMSKDKIIRKHQNTLRAQTFGRTVSNEKELRERLGLPARRNSLDRPPNSRKPSKRDPMTVRRSLEQYGHFDVNGRTITFHENKATAVGGRGGAGRAHIHRPRIPALSRDAKIEQRKASQDPSHKRQKRRERLILLREEKDRFDAMREIQEGTHRFKQYYALSMSIIAFGILWCVGAAVFMVAERRIQNMSYFQALYFCWVSLLTIGYGDLSPKSNAGKPFFVLWSLVAIPTMTILVSDMGDTVISAINRGTFTLADWTVMPKEGVWKDFLDHHPKIRSWLEMKVKEREASKRIEKGFDIQDPEADSGALDATNPSLSPDSSPTEPTLERLAADDEEVTEHDLARKLAVAIKRTANDLRAPQPRKYSYEEWVEFTRLIRFSAKSPEEVEEEEKEVGMVEWDWIGEDSPMLADVSESEWVLDRLCESLNRYTRKQARDKKVRQV